MIEELSRKAKLNTMTLALFVMSFGFLNMSYAADNQNSNKKESVQMRSNSQAKSNFIRSTPNIDGRRLVGKIKISNDQQLEAGDVVTLKLYDRQGRLLPENVRVMIKLPQQENTKSWTYELANEINQNLVGIRAGRQTKLGIVSPFQNDNYVYASKNSIVSSIETQVEKGEQNSAFSIANLSHQVPFNADGTHVTFDLASMLQGTVTAKLYDENDMASGSFEQELSPGNKNMSLRIRQPNIGKYRLQLTFKSSDGSLTQQQRVITVTHDETDV